MKCRILMISVNYYPESTGIGKYNKEMTNYAKGNLIGVTHSSK